MDFATAHALLRDRSHWRGSAVGVQAATGRDAGDGADGDLVLARVPGPEGGKALATGAPPYAREASGIAVGPCRALFVADTAHGRVLFVDRLCGAQAWLPAHPGSTGAPGQFAAPRGLACSGDALLVADFGNARVASLALPGLEANVAWPFPGEPLGVAVDGKGRMLVVDGSAPGLHRRGRNGARDAPFDAAVAASGELARPMFVACGAGDLVLVSDVQHDAVFVFDGDGTFSHRLPGPAGWQPAAVAAWATRWYVADAASGRIAVFDHADGSTQLAGYVCGWNGPVTALAADGDALYIKPALDAAFHRFPADAAFLAQGSFTAGPFDAGEDRDWERAWAQTQLPAGTTVRVELACHADATPPGSADWITLPGTDALLSLLATAGRRFAWLRLTLATTDPATSPRLRQARLATAGEDYLDYLPLTYRDNDGAGGFLSRWLRLIRGEFERVEALLDDMPRIADPRFATPDALAWLAGWFGLELPQIADDAERRALVARAITLLARRGTRQSIAEFVQLHTGIEPVIVEGFAGRSVWVLGQGSRLGFDTRLPALDPLGMVVPEALPGPDGREPEIGRVVVGDSGPLADHEAGLPLHAEEAYRFCVVVDAYRASDPGTVREIARIVEREKPAHTDYRIELVAPELRVGLQARIGIDTIVGGDPPPLQLGGSRLSATSHLPPADLPRVGQATLDGSLTLT